MWHNLVTMGIPLLEKVIRTIVVYVVLALLLRIAGKRDLAAFNTFDLVVMLLLANVVQNAIIGPDNSLWGGVIAAAILVAVNALMVRLAVLSGPFVRVLEGTPTVLVRNGRYDSAALRHEGLRKADVAAALRKQGASTVREVQEMTLEPGGTLVVQLIPEEENATRGDIATVVERMAELERKLDVLLSKAAR
ncbi:MAG TPA: YetF domain-containing protein [Streptosporangiaceae bacterium]|jgi:uncharacterized membrane protein YcaP (DUF421 family)